MEEFKIEIAKAFNDYINTEGCDCCRDKKGHEKAYNRLAELLGVPLIECFDKTTYYDWDKFIQDNAKG